MCFVNWNDSKLLCFNLESCCFGQDCSHFPFWTAFSLALCRGTSFCLQRATPRKIMEGIHFLPSCPSPPTSDLACSLTACHFGCIGALLIELFISGYWCLSLGKSSCQTNTLWFAVLLASWSGSLIERREGHWCNSRVFRNVSFSRVCEGKIGWLAFWVFWVHLISRTNAKLESSITISAWYKSSPL